MTTTEQRVSHLEGAYEHLATKADVLQLENRLTKEIGNLVKWVAGFQLLGLGAIVAIIKFVA